MQRAVRQPEGAEQGRVCDWAAAMTATLLPSTMGLLLHSNSKGPCVWKERSTRDAIAHPRADAPR
jgi:hypothetical protein